jgi:poly-beta-1,6-N-acetyl-D-glucosamine synthase
MNNQKYVLITPVRNEQATIGITIESVIQQTVPPVEWIIVSDESTDRTDEIINEYAAKHPFIRLHRLTRRPERNFASVVFAVESGIKTLRTTDYGYIGLLDADVRFAPTYYEEILSRFVADAKLGLAGGLVVDCIAGVRYPSHQSLKDVAGAVQFFSRKCFESLGGLVAIPEGGWDAITCAQARRHGFRSQTFPELEVDHLKPRNVAQGNLFRRTWQYGVREYALGNHPLFEMLKCAYRCAERPFLIGSILRFTAFVWCHLTLRKRVLSSDVVGFIRKEQMNRMLRRNGNG